jgi:hypothetical protein
VRVISLYTIFSLCHNDVLSFLSSLNVSFHSKQGKIIGYLDLDSKLGSLLILFFIVLWLFNFCKAQWQISESLKFMVMEF